MPGQVQLQYDFNNPGNPILDLAINGVPQFQGPLAAFNPLLFNVQPIGQRVLSLNCVDNDGDAVCNRRDNCVDANNTNQQNVDGDPRGDLCDCDPGDPQRWDAPGPVPPGGLTLDHDPLSGVTTLDWFAPFDLGATLPPLYDTLRADAATDFALGSICLEPGGNDQQSTEATEPMPGDLFFYLVRPVSDCGEGGLGSDSAGSPRSAAGC